MSVLRRLLPEGMAGRFALLLAAALIAANLVALALLSVERIRLDRAARTAREIERIVSLVPAIEAVAPDARGQIARSASTRFSRVRVRSEPLVADLPDRPRSQALTQQLAEALPGRLIHAAILVRRPEEWTERDVPPWRDAEQPEDRRGDGWSGRWRGREVIVISIELAGTDGVGPQWLNVVAREIRHRRPGVEEEVFFLVLGLSLVSVLGVGLIFVRRLTRPLAQIAEAARAAGRGDRSARVPEEGAREMREAAAAFNDMQARIARFDSERMRTLAAVGHDLRTPITSLRIRAELLDEAEGEPIIRTLDEMGVMANGLVAYARGSGPAEAPQTLDLAAFLHRLCEDRGAAFHAGTQVSLTAHPVALGRALGNLIDNALRYGGSAQVRLEREGNTAVIGVEDEGAGIPPERLDDMFEPFVRGEDSRNVETGGAGLGLSIARNVVAAHGGTVTLQNREGGGLRAEVRLPIDRGA